MKETNSNPGYERSDAKSRPIITFGIGLIALLFFSLVISLWLDQGLTPPAPKEDKYALPAPPVAETTWPVLQTNPYDEIREYRREEEIRLTRYEWIDRQNGIARIPIKRAMTVFLDREKGKGR